MRGYDEWKTTNPADALLGSVPQSGDLCPVCGAKIEPYAAMVEVFETLGKLVCEDCHEGELEQYAEDNSQFGVGGVIHALPLHHRTSPLNNAAPHGSNGARKSREGERPNPAD